MPSFTFTSPEGKSYTVNGPDGATKEQAFQMLQAQLGTVSKPDPSHPAKSAADDVGIGEALLIGAGRTGDKIISGVRQLYNSAIGDEKTLKELKTREDGNDAAYAELQARRPISTSVGEALPYIAVPASAGILPSALAVGGLEAAKYGTAQERMQRGLLGAGTTAAGGVVGKVFGKALSPVSDDLINESQRAALKSADKVGVKPRLSEVTGSPYIAGLEDFAARTPGGSGVMKKFELANKRAANQTAARAIGENADELTTKVFSDASQRLGKVFEDIKNVPGKPIEIGADVASTADDVLRVQSKMLPSQQDSMLIDLAKKAKALSKFSGKIDGEAFQLTRSGLSEAAFDANGTNRVLYGKLLQALDDSAEQSLKKNGFDDLAAALKTARPQYANLKTLEKGSIVEGGNISPAKLASALRTANPAAFKEGKMAGNPLYDVAVIGENMKSLKAGSPSYERAVNSSLLDTALKAPFAYGAAKLTTSPVMTAYPRYVGTTKGARVAGQVAEPTARALSYALMNRMFPLTAPVMAENN